MKINPTSQTISGEWRVASGECSAFHFPFSAFRLILTFLLSPFTLLADFCNKFAHGEEAAAGGLDLVFAGALENDFRAAVINYFH